MDGCNLRNKVYLEHLLKKTKVMCSFIRLFHARSRLTCYLWQSNKLKLTYHKRLLGILHCLYMLLTYPHLTFKKSLLMSRAGKTGLESGSVFTREIVCLVVYAYCMTVVYLCYPL